ncbi:YafY family transcriptional regulator [Lacrimispora sp. NSJ-141]|uniref:YafY family transcriptional regulator n=1 Tax=Lientehia hominis TaxID=2897778 RepID=A0AAP2RI60_9FIRM|nr:YafY family protein [Lientehia hominis]MCD2492662.1 YafY family transcriptional regulator [Lientehia hominis]
MKIDRLIGIITILLQQDKITAPELAERFEVSRRTINRDIEVICKAGIPLITTQGYGGGISIDDKYKIDRSFFTDEELQIIFAGLKGIDSVSKTSYLKTLLEKLSDKENRVISEDIIILDLASHYQKPLTQKIELIKYAIRKRRLLSFNYYYSKGEQQKRIEPYHLIFKWSSWYVFGYCPDRQGYRLFKLNRLWELQVMEETYLVRTIPETELELDDYFTSGSIHLKALFAPSEKYRLIEEYGIGCFSSTDSGELLLERDFASYENMREWIFSLNLQNFF